MKNLYPIVLVLGVACASQVAKAGVTVEPYVGYEVGSATSAAVTSAPAVATIASVAKVNGVGYGAKLGYSLPFVGFGFDYMRDSFHVSTGGTDTASSYGVFGQLRFFKLMSFNATYFFHSSLKYSGNEATGNGYKVGFGISPIPFLSVNLDYVRDQYDESTAPAGVTFSSFKMNAGRGLLSVSVPISL